ncbi:phosphotransferase family protein [Nocardia transvalensis]|uniref:phosphotransferase family protein n=1 Tax=Nocardia transvalensis TaxID=37333 RepID=UPI001E4F289D|nr:aminoglycoside phosphotransferase family protein [Nocardia transvalensis]
MSADVELPGDWENRARGALTASPRPELADGDLRLLGAGMESVALLLERPEGAYVLRLPQGSYGAEGIGREAALLPELAGLLPVPIPRFLFTAPNPLGPGEFCVYPIVPGESLSPEQWYERGLLTLPSTAELIAKIIDGVHSFPVTRASALGIETRDLREDFTEDLESVRAEVIPLLAPAAAKALLGAWEEYLGEDANFDYSPSLIHADVSLDHLLVTGDRISGLIDFGDVEIGDPDYDLCYLYPETDPEFVRRVQRCRGTELDHRLEAKLRFWACADPALDVLHALENEMPRFLDDRLRVLTAALQRFQPHD